MEDIAVIGLGLRFPGDASSPERLWDVLAEGKSQRSEFPKERLNIDGYFHPGGDREGSVSTSAPMGSQVREERADATRFPFAAHIFWKGTLPRSMPQ